SSQEARPAPAPAGRQRAIPRRPSELAGLIDRPTRRRAGVFRLAIRRQISRLHDPRRIAAMAILILVGGIFSVGLIARGEAAATLGTGNITLFLTFALWSAPFTGPRLAGLLWGLATWMKWAPAVLWVILAPRARAWGVVWLGVSALLSLATLPLTIVQLQALFGFGSRPIRLDYLVLLWAAVPWLWIHPHPLWWLSPREWPRVAASLRA